MQHIAALAVSLLLALYSTAGFSVDALPGAGEKLECGGSIEFTFMPDDISDTPEAFRVELSQGLSADMDSVMFTEAEGEAVPGNDGFALILYSRGENASVSFTCTVTDECGTSAVCTVYSDSGSCRIMRSVMQTSTPSPEETPAAEAVAQTEPAAPASTSPESSATPAYTEESTVPAYVYIMAILCFFGLIYIVLLIVQGIRRGRQS